MAQSERIDVEALIETRRFGGFTLRVLVLALLALIADGYDVQVMAFAAPSLLREWHLQRAALAPALSAGLLGILVGSPLFGWLGDRIGRKSCIIIGSSIYGLVCLSCLLARDLPTLVALRFVTGLGLGGVLPNAIAIAAEYAPPKLRAAIGSLIGVGITIGGVTPGLIAAQLPSAGTWRALFWVGGLAPLAIAALVALLLPESALFLIRRGSSRQRIERLVREIDPGAEIGPQTVLEASAPAPAGSGGFGALFKGELALITPMLWVMYAASLLSIYLLTSWMPLLLEASGFSPQKAASINALFQVGGVAGCVVGSLLMARLGVRMVAGFFALALAAVAVTARASLGPEAMVWAVIACGFALVGAQCGLNGTAGTVYPTLARAKGVGLGLGVGRIGSVIGPLVGGAMVAAGFTSARDLFLLPLLPLALGTLAAFVVMGPLLRRQKAGSS